MNRVQKSFAVSIITAALSVAVLFLGVGSRRVFARYFNSTTATITTSPDLWCQGQYNDTFIPSELCIDHTSNLIPTRGNLTVGSANYPFANIYATTFHGAFTGTSTNALPISVGAGTVYTSTFNATGSLAVKAAVTAGTSITAGTTLTASGQTTLSSATLSGLLQLGSKTIAQLAATIPTAIGQIVLCSDCTVDLTATSTQTVTPNWQGNTESRASNGTNAH